MELKTRMMNCRADTIVMQVQFGSRMRPLLELQQARCTFSRLSACSTEAALRQTTGPWAQYCFAPRVESCPCSPARRRSSSTALGMAT